MHLMIPDIPIIIKPNKYLFVAHFIITKISQKIYFNDQVSFNYFVNLPESSGNL